MGCRLKLVKDPFTRRLFLILFFSQTDSWNVLLREAQNQRIQKARKTYDKLVEKYPTCGRFWKMYIEHELKSRNFDQVEKLFKKCLMTVLNLDLWKTYLAYVRETKGRRVYSIRKFD